MQRIKEMHNGYKEQECQIDNQSSGFNEDIDQDIEYDIE